MNDRLRLLRGAYTPWQSFAPATATPHKRTQAETLTSQLNAPQDKIGDLELLFFAQGNRDMVMEAMTSLQNAMNDAFNRAAQ